MSKQAMTIERLGRAFCAPANGVVGLVDELLSAALIHRMKLTWNDGVCEIAEFADDGSPARFPLPHSVFRAILARIAVLCSGESKATTPYSGAGEIKVGGDEQFVAAAYTNDPNLQMLRLSPISMAAGGRLESAAKAKTVAK